MEYDREKTNSNDHNVNIDLTPAPAWKRLVGFIIDFLPLYTLAGIVAREIHSGYRGYYYDNGSSYIFLYDLLFSTIYYLLFEGLFGRTLGKLLTGTIVVDSYSFKKASFGKVLGRTFSRLIPFDGLSFLFSSTPRGWHDSIPKTTVMNMKAYKAFQAISHEERLTILNLSPKPRLSAKTKRLIIALAICLPVLFLVITSIRMYHNEKSRFTPNPAPSSSPTNIVQPPVAPPITLHVASAGTLSSLIAENKKDEIVDLTLTGSLDSRDIRFIREMLGKTPTGEITAGNLKILNLADVNITNYEKSGRVSKHRYYKFRDSDPSPSFNIKTDPLTDSNLTTCYYYQEDNSYYQYWHTSNKIMSEFMFYNCGNLTNIIIPKNTIAIRANAFSGCNKIISITIPTHVASIETTAFIDCSKLAEIIVSEQNKNYISQNGILFNKGKSKIVRFPPAKQGSYAIPNSITSIESFAFYGCSGMTDIIIGSNVNLIGAGAFANCNKLTAIKSKKTIPPTLDSDCFYNVDKTTCKLYVPKGSYAAYWSAPGWGEFNNIIEVE